jgi:hypothetical protein
MTLGRASQDDNLKVHSKSSFVQSAANQQQNPGLIAVGRLLDQARAINRERQLAGTSLSANYAMQMRKI